MIVWSIASWTMSNARVNVFISVRTPFYVRNYNGLVLDVAEGTDEAGSGIIAYDQRGSDSQAWYRVDLEDGWFQLLNVKNPEMVC